MKIQRGHRKTRQSLTGVTKNLAIFSTPLALTPRPSSPGLQMDVCGYPADVTTFHHKKKEKDRELFTTAASQIIRLEALLPLEGQPSRKAVKESRQGILHK